MFRYFFTWCTSLGEKIQNGSNGVQDFADYYKAYFAETAICGTIFWIGVAIAAAFAALFYFGICNHSFKLAKRYLWFVVLAIVFCVTFFTSRSTIIGHDTGDGETSTGIFATAYKLESQQIENGGEDLDYRGELSEIALQFREQFKPKGENVGVSRDSLPIEMALANGIYSILVFFILSLLVRRRTIHGSAIPF